MECEQNRTGWKAGKKPDALLNREFKRAKIFAESIRHDSSHTFGVLLGTVSRAQHLKKLGKCADILTEAGEEKFRNRDFGAAAGAFELAAHIRHAQVETLKAGRPSYKPMPDKLKNQITEADALEVEARRRYGTALEKAGMAGEYSKAKGLIETIRRDRDFYKNYSRQTSDDRRFYLDKIVSSNEYVGELDESGAFLIKIAKVKIENGDFHGAANAFAEAAELYRQQAEVRKYRNDPKGCMPDEYRKRIPHAYNLEAESYGRQAEALEKAGDPWGACKALERELDAHSYEIYAFDHIDDVEGIPHGCEFPASSPFRRGSPDIEGMNKAKKAAEQARKKMEELRGEIEKHGIAERNDGIKALG